jgi:acetylornithine/N-succinyldiaminopimelate aminotransferase
LTTLAVIEEDGLMARAPRWAKPAWRTLRGAGRAVAGFVASPRRRPDDRHRARSPLRRPGQAGAGAGLLINVTAEKVVRLLPPLVMSDAEGAELVAMLVPLIKEFLA